MAIQPQFPIQYRGNYIDGRFVIPTDGNGEWVVRSPADFSDELAKIVYSYASVNEAVGAARKAFIPWRRKTVAERAELLRKYQTILKRREAEFAEVLAREVGKPLWESKTEVTTMVNKIDVTLNESMKIVEDLTLPQIMDGTNGVARHRPLGVMAVIGPFNFPGHLPNGHIVPALATGNTVVFKPSEKAPLVGQLMAECFQEAGFPAGVFNLVQGEKEVGRRLCVHEEVSGVLFTGSYEVGTRIKQDTLLQHWKLLALEMGGKNAAIVWKDTDLDYVVHETLFGAYVTCGQRCSATSRIILHSSMAEKFIARFHERAKAFTIGHPLENPFMGPLVESAAVDRYTKFLGIAEREGCDIIMRGKALALPHKGNYVAPSICVVQDSSVEAARKSVYQQTELFGPNVAISVVDDLEQAVQLANITQYGLVTSIFSPDRAVYEKAWDGLEAGLVNWNRTTVGASSRLPFGGLKKSGNHFPTALPSPLYCTYPVASLETAEPKQVAPSSPGLNWK